MTGKAVAFYWTLPIPGLPKPFVRLSSDVNQAAKESKTIHYQIKLVRSWAKNNKKEILKEGVYLELEPDRAGRTWKQFEKGMPDELNELIEICKKEDAILLYVDFSHSSVGRSHHVMDEIVGGYSIRTRAISPHQYGIVIDGDINFDLKAHFRKRAKERMELSSDKLTWRDSALIVARAALDEAGNLNGAARILNESDHKTSRNRKWTADNLRKFLKKYGADESQSSDQADGGT